MKRATFLLKLLLLAAIVTQEGLLSWQLMTSKMYVLLIDAGLLTIFLYLQVRSANNTHMYMIYVYSVVAKITAIYYVSLPRALIIQHEEPDGGGPSLPSPLSGALPSVASFILPSPLLGALPSTASPNVRFPIQVDTYVDSIHIVSSTIVISILVYILFFFVTDFDLLKVRFINVEIFFCLLIITHVAIDFLDISDFFYSVNLHFLLYHFRVVQELSVFTNPDLFVHASMDRKSLIEFYSFCLHAYQTVFILFGVLLCVNIAIHAYSLPSFSYESNKRRKLSAKGGGQVGDHPSSGPLLLHSYSGDGAFSRWSCNQNAANRGGKDLYGNPPSGALTRRGSSLGGPAQLEGKHSISRGITRGIAAVTSSFSPSSAALASTSIEASLLQSKVGGDAMSCLKYISIYSFFFTDVCLFTARLFLYLVFSATSCSPQFMMKNLCFAIIHGSRIYRKSKFYNRRRGEKGRKASSVKGGSSPHEGEMFTSECEMSSDTCEFSTDTSEETRSEESSKHHPDEQPKQRRHIRSGSLHLKGSRLHFKGSSLHFKGSNHVNTELLSRSYPSIDTINIDVIQNAEYRRIDSLSYEKILPRFYFHYLKYNGVNFKRYMSCYVDQIEKNSMGYSLIFLFFFILIATKIAILVVTYTMDFDQDLNRHLYELTYLWNINALKDSWILRINSFIILAYSFCSFLLYVVTCSLFDGIFMSLMYVFNLLSFFFVLLIMSKYNPSYDMLDYFNKNKNTLVVLFLFGYLAYLFLADTYMFIYMLLGRKYMTYRRRVKTRSRDEAKGTAGQNAETDQELLTPISVVSTFLLKLIKHMKGPIMLNRIIISKNLIKNTRVDNFLFFCHVKEIAIKLVLYFFSCFLLLREEAINFCFVLSIFSVNVIFSVMYLIFSKVDRDVAMESIFTQALFLHLSGASEGRREVKRADTSKNQQEKGAFHEPTVHPSVYEKYSYDYTVLFENCLNYF
ncbi:hypothetical protein C922_02728 [Plasmodium inui San Antonio 1]|uniref:Uncharacterized protein n=1 Tax=Plasmodium inui San Antonio 1 TaxID=1237626 RepID=W7A6A5_9APIC|nr:hypothetical protein C922_02728 [Plasmodium inui San Antonio 1]EUD66743.1 hypothetical protein C922_02728 [Plasmodium inui San Antonio 1]